MVPIHPSQWITNNTISRHYESYDEPMSPSSFFLIAVSASFLIGAVMISVMYLAVKDVVRQGRLIASTINRPYSTITSLQQPYSTGPISSNAATSSSLTPDRQNSQQQQEYDEYGTFGRRLQQLADNDDYGSFGRRLKVFGKFTGSMASLQDAAERERPLDVTLVPHPTTTIPQPQYHHHQRQRSSPLVSQSNIILSPSPSFSASSLTLPQFENMNSIDTTSLISPTNSFDPSSMLSSNTLNVPPFDSSTTIATSTTVTPTHPDQQQQQQDVSNFTDDDNSNSGFEFPSPTTASSVATHVYQTSRDNESSRIVSEALYLG